jgi:thymidylate kinase
MIIELLGAPSVGKTTLARSLAERLRNRQIPIELWLSYRPAELAKPAGMGHATRRHGPSAVLLRIARPTFELLKATSKPLGDSSDATLCEKLMQILEPRNVLWSVRMRQYIRRLAYAWLRAAQSSGIVLFDQAFAQAICSLAVVASEQSEWRIECALRETPSAHLFIRLRADDEVIMQRLRARALEQSVIERLLELDLDANLRIARMIDTVQGGLSRLERPVLSFDTQDYGGLERALTILEREITKLYQEREPHGRGSASPADCRTASSL